MVTSPLKETSLITVFLAKRHFTRMKGFYPKESLHEFVNILLQKLGNVYKYLVIKS